MEPPIIKISSKKSPVINKDRSIVFTKYFQRGVFPELDKAADILRLSADSHAEDGGFLEALEDMNYKHTFTDSHQDAIVHSDTTRASHAFFDTIDTQRYPINDLHYITAIFTNEIPVDLFRLNWERDWYGKFEQFKGINHIPQIRVFDLEPFIARLKVLFFCRDINLVVMRRSLWRTGIHKI